jgi:thioredoxin reductase (NADPH)
MYSKEKVENLVIVGSGPAGLTAALYAARANLAPLVFEGNQPGGQLTITTDVENFPGFPDGIQGPDLVDLMRKQAERFGSRCEREVVLGVDLLQRPFVISTEKGGCQTRVLIVATGATAKLLALASEARFMGKGVSACATCDGFFFRDQEVIVVGGGDTACEEALLLTRFARTVHIIHRRDRLRASKILQDRVFNNKKIDVIWNSVVEEILGEKERGVTGVLLKNRTSGEVHEKRCDGVFVAIGHKPNTEIFRGQIEMDEKGYILTKNGTKTTVAGVFAAGDVQDPKYRQAITAAGSGCMAAMEVIEFLEEAGEIQAK